MRTSELKVNDVRLNIALEDGRGLLSVSAGDQEGSALSCSLDNLLAVCKGSIRYCIAGKEIDGTLEKMDGHILLRINRNGACTQYVFPLETFEQAIQPLIPQRAGNWKGHLYLS